MNLLTIRSHKNRRLAPRHALNVPMCLRIRRGSQHAEEIVVSQNLSLRGVLFRTDLQVRTGAMVDLLVEMPEAVTEVPSAKWLCMGHVVRVAAAGAQLEVAVQFDFYEVSQSEKLHFAVGAGVRGLLASQMRQ